MLNWQFKTVLELSSANSTSSTNWHVRTVHTKKKTVIKCNGNVKKVVPTVPSKEVVRAESSEPIMAAGV